MMYRVTLDTSSQTPWGILYVPTLNNDEYKLDVVATGSGSFTASASIEDEDGSYYVNVIQTGCPTFRSPGGKNYSVLNPSGSALMKLIYARYLRCFAPNWRRNAWARPSGLNAAWRSSPPDFGKILAKERWALGCLTCKYLYLLDSFNVFKSPNCSICEVSPVTYYRTIKMLVELIKGFSLLQTRLTNYDYLWEQPNILTELCMGHKGVPIQWHRYQDRYLSLYPNHQHSSSEKSHTILLMKYFNNLCC